MSAATAEALIALGGNIGDVRTTFDRAIACLCRDNAVRLTARSSDYRTPPWGMTDQPAFINAAIAVATSLPPRGLLARALECERKLGLDRARKQHWGPRIIDLDLVWMVGEAIGEAESLLRGPGLTLPHPGVSTRNFVLYPLADIAPTLAIPGHGNVLELLRRAGDAGITVLEQ